MLFTTFTFVGFLLVVLTLFYVLPERYRRYLLLAASLLFYMAWRAKFVVLILGLITVDYFAALWISRREGAARRWLSVLPRTSVCSAGSSTRTSLARRGFTCFIPAGLCSRSTSSCRLA